MALPTNLINSNRLPANKDQQQGRKKKSPHQPTKLPQRELNNFSPIRGSDKPPVPSPTSPQLTPVQELNQINKPSKNPPNISSGIYCSNTAATGAR